MTAESENRDGSRTLLLLLRDVLLERRTGKLAVEVGGTERLFFFVSGDLYLNSDHALSKVAGAPSSSGPPSEGWVDKALDYFEALGEVNHHFTEGTDEISTDLVGPITTTAMIMQGAVRGLDEFQLLRSLGGEERSYVANTNAPLAREVHFDPEEAFLLSRLEKPTAVKDLLRLPDMEPLAVAERLCRMASIDLIRPFEQSQSEARSSLLSQKLLERFDARIAEDLERNPLSLDREAHRRKLADLMARLGGLNYYELLGTSVGSSADEIHSAYTRLARLVHPRHSKALGLEGMEAGVVLLFERATEAYLTLSDQDRRGQYLQKVGAFSDGSLFGRTEESRKEEVEELAARNYKMAEQLVNRQDYYYAIELLNQAIRMEARSEYFSLLAHCQSQNPQWYDKAAANYSRAIQLNPNDADLRTALAEVFEKTGNKARARTEYQAALGILPGHPEATSGLLRVDTKTTKEKSSIPWWRKIFGDSESGSDS
jgi:curved DNA-binding protein CbpA